MTNDEKAKHIADVIFERSDNETFYNMAVKSALQMAEWKDEQTKHLIIELSNWFNERGFFRDDLQCNLEHQARTFLEIKGFNNAYE